MPDRKKYTKIDNKYYEVGVEVDKTKRLEELKSALAKIDEDEAAEIKDIKAGYRRKKKQLQDEITELEGMQI